MAATDEFTVLKLCRLIDPNALRRIKKSGETDSGGKDSERDVSW
jgi:hypothetical protein